MVHGTVTDTSVEIRGLCEKWRVRRLHVFGSATSDRFDPARSDLDFLVEFDFPMTPSQHADAYFGLLEDLEDLFGRSIDLIEPGPIKNPYFRQAVEKTRQPLYEASR